MPGTVGRWPPHVKEVIMKNERIHKNTL